MKTLEGKIPILETNTLFSKPRPFYAHVLLQNAAFQLTSKQILNPHAFCNLGMGQISIEIYSIGFIIDIFYFKLCQYLRQGEKNFQNKLHLKL